MQIYTFYFIVAVFLINFTNKFSYSFTYIYMANNLNQERLPVSLFVHFSSKQMNKDCNCGVFCCVYN